jgi:radical SAM protein with 4Fe4S-binding SPASM domain
MSILLNRAEASRENLVPMQATLELTYRCNERCGHCYLATYDDAADGRPPLTLTEWQHVLDDLADAGTLLLILMGGEAMMHPHFWSIAEHGANKNFALSVITNGLLIDDRAADRMRELGFYNTTISLYSLNADIHDKMTKRKGSHARTLAAIERIRNRGMMLTVNCLLTRDNIDSYFELEEWCRSRGIKLQFDPMVTPKSDGSLEPTALRATSEQLFRFYKTLKDRGQGPIANADEADDPVCNAGRGKCAINVYGDLLTCLEVRESLGNLKTASFQDLWHSPLADKLRGYQVRDLKFESSCGDGAYCDHCPGVARAETGDGMAPVPFLMEIARIKRKVNELR